METTLTSQSRVTSTTTTTTTVPTAAAATTTTAITIDQNNNNNNNSSSSNPIKQTTLTLDPAICQKAARYAVRVHDEMSRRSQLLRQQEQNPTAATDAASPFAVIPTFEPDEVLPYLGELLGKGGFNSVYELERVTLINNDNNNPAQEQRQRLQQEQPKLAVKFLSDEALASPEDFCNGAADLFMEAKYLTALAAHPHPSLIQLHGVCAAGPTGFEKVERAGFFLLIDRLYDTLDRRIDVWREVKRRRQQQQQQQHVVEVVVAQHEQQHQDEATATATSPTPTPTQPSNDKVIKGLFLQRLLVAQDIASAVRHLHKLQIIFRDLKPDNVGFDYEGQVKLFDFGLAKELDPMQRVEQPPGLLYTMSGGTGSRRFMAPEVANSEPYGLSADMYSFGILLWELITLEKAFGRMSVEEHRERVIKGKERPELDPTWNDALQAILEGCWQRNPFKRPSARDAYKALRQEIQTMIAEEFPKQAAAEDERRWNRRCL